MLLLFVTAEDEDRRSRQWIQEINQKRGELDEYHTLMPDHRRKEKRFYINFRMTIECVKELLQLIDNAIRKHRISTPCDLSSLRYCNLGDSDKKEQDTKKQFRKANP